MNNQENINEQLEKEVKDVNNQFIEFLHTKGIVAKFKLAFSNMKESTKEIHQKDVENFQKVKQKSIAENQEFYEFLHTKGFKAKVKLVIENIKKGAKESKQKTKEQIANAKYKNNINAETLNKEFIEFLKTKGLENKYQVIIEEIK